MSARMLYLRCLSPLHVGTGQASGVIDLPVAREVHTNWPYVPASSIKGTLRDVCTLANGAPNEQVNRAFGRPPDRDDDPGGAGGLWFANAQLLAFPVRSYFGTFAWLSCPLALRRWQADLASIGATPPPSLSATPAIDDILVAPGCDIAHQGAVYLEDYRLSFVANETVGALADVIAAAAIGEGELRPLFRPRFGIIHDDLFTFLVESTTEVIARIALADGTKTVRPGGLWYEEAVPEQTIFACPLPADPRVGGEADGLFAVLPADGKPIQLGGGASVGRGRVALRVLGG